MTTPLPEPSANGAEDHTTISRRFIQNARLGLERGDPLQASEKTWGAATQAAKAIAVTKGWPHDRHGLLMAIAEQLALEYDRPYLSARMNVAGSMHRDVYVNFQGEAGFKSPSIPPSVL